MVRRKKGKVRNGKAKLKKNSASEGQWKREVEKRKEGWKEMVNQVGQK